MIIFIQKKNNIDYILTLPYYLLLLDFVKVIPIWGDIGGYNGYTLFVLLYFMMGYIVNSKWLRNNVKSILILTISLCVYLFFRMSFADDTVNAISRYGSLVYVLILVPISMKFISPERFKKLINILYNYLIFYLIGTIILSTLKIGPNMYNTGIIYGLKDDQLNAPVFALITIWFFKKHLKKTNYLRIITFISILIFLFTFKRTPIIMLGIGLLFLILNFKNYFTRLSLIAAVVAVFSIQFFFLRSQQVQKRDKYSTSIDIDNEGRFIEMLNVNDIIKKDNNLFYFGNGKLFFTRGEYELDKFQDRPMHSFYGEILLGAGYIGLIMFLIFIASILFSSFSLHYSKKKYLLDNPNSFTKSKQPPDNVYLYFSLCSVIILLFTLFVGSIRYIGYNALFFFILGSTLGQLSYNNGIPARHNN